jgi:hypothetical protein
VIIDVTTTAIGNAAAIRQTRATVGVVAPVAAANEPKQRRVRRAVQEILKAQSVAIVGRT